ncbi:alpha/beta fold hydrolase [uncultured Nostoc sp.]|uniref:alpha/beta fold hydrolase n=1 Tax=uncultured Nostoc sp. TaxID=340711 RepID=UPI0035C9F95F
MLALMFGTLTVTTSVDAQQEQERSITTPPAVSKAALERVRTQKRGQYAVPADFTSGFVDADGTRLHYVAGGRGSPIVFVHGFGSTWKMWEPAMKEFASRHRVIAIDMPGLGQSGPSSKGYSSEEVSSVLLAGIKKLTTEPIIYVCHDLCISASYPLVARNQGFIRKVSFMDSPIPDRAMFTYSGLTANGPGLGWHFGFFAFGDIAERLIANDPKLFFNYFINDYAGKKEVFTDELMDELIEPYSRLPNLHAAFSGYYAAHPQDVTQNEALLRAGKLLNIPTLIVSGSKGVNDVLPKQVEARFIKDKSLLHTKILESCGHWLLEECSAQVNAELRPFLDR